VCVKESDVSKRYRILLGTAVIVAIGAVGGIAAAEQGGNSAEHRQNPTTTTEAAAETTTTTTTTLGAKPLAADDQSDAAEQSNRTAALCHALNSGSARGQEMKGDHGRPFQDLDCTDVAPLGGGHEGDENESADGAEDQGQGQGGPPENPGEDHGQGLGSDNPNAGGHGKP
jgi:hypothetical protein